MDEIELRLNLRNSETKELLLHVEPWGEQYPMAPEDSFELVFRGPNDGGVELELEDGGVTLWAWTGSTVWVFKNGNEVPEGIAGERPKVPQYPSRHD